MTKLASALLLLICVCAVAYSQNEEVNQSIPGLSSPELNKNRIESDRHLLADQPPTETSRQKWEYKILLDGLKDESDINDLGEQGWEMCGLSTGGVGYLAVFKRPNSNG